MIASLIRAALAQRWLALGVGLAVIACGIYAFREQPIDAYPDISAQMVQIISVFPGRAPEEVRGAGVLPLLAEERREPEEHAVFGRIRGQRGLERGDGLLDLAPRDERVRALEQPAPVVAASVARHVGPRAPSLTAAGTRAAARPGAMPTSCP